MKQETQSTKWTITGPFLSIICLLVFGALGFGTFLGWLILILLGLA